jgi:hypothetical protein
MRPLDVHLPAPERIRAGQHAMRALAPVSRGCLHDRAHHSKQHAVAVHPPGPVPLCAPVLAENPTDLSFRDLLMPQGPPAGWYPAVGRRRARSHPSQGPRQPAEADPRSAPHCGASSSENPLQPHSGHEDSLTRPVPGFGKGAIGTDPEWIAPSRAQLEVAAAGCSVLCTRPYHFTKIALIFGPYVHFTAADLGRFAVKRRPSGRRSGPQRPDLPPLNEATPGARIPGGRNQGRARNATRKGGAGGGHYPQTPRG